MRDRLLLERIEQLQAEHKRAEEANKAAKEQAFRYASAFCVGVNAVGACACLLCLTAAQGGQCYSSDL